MNQMMKAIVLEKTGAPQVLKVSEVPIPTAKPAWVLVKIRAFGVNRSELMLRAYEANEDYIRLPRIPGIECVGEVVDPSDSNLSYGQRVISFMGGMGRSFDGSYAEYSLLPRDHVFTVESTLPWSQLAAIPETWFTAWGSLIDCLEIQKVQKLFVRGGSSALGLASIQLAKSFGCEVAASSRSESKRELLKRAGADHIIIGGSALSNQWKAAELPCFDAILELIGPSTLMESMSFAARHGKVCVSGILGDMHAIEDFDPIKYIPNGVSLMGFFSNYPDQKTIDAIFAHIKKHDLSPLIGREFSFDEIVEAHRVMESNAAHGKIVVTLD